MPIFAASTKAESNLHNLYETEVNITNTYTNTVKTKPKRKLFCKIKQKEEISPEIIVPIERNGFVVFPAN